MTEFAETYKLYNNEHMETVLFKKYHISQYTCDNPGRCQGL